MTADARERRALELLDAALDLDPAAVAAFLDAECDGDVDLRARVDALLRADAREATPLDRTADSLLDLLEERAGETGDRIGPWRIVRELGRGGMGVVFLAERDDEEFSRLAALKLIRPGPDSDVLAERFVRERQILADLRHPAIAQLYDGGRTGAGLPYLVMEYVEGAPIDAWCRERGLGLEERLRLFRRVCDAVQHAHQNLVVHRDLKPAHVLVTDAGEVKLLDFGIARLLDTDGLSGDTVVHAFTPRYASPEQLSRGAVTTATDVYALGVMLAELLSPDELRGDLAVIQATAVREEPAERYATAAALRDDIDRLLRHEPIAARPENAAYRLSRFIRRRRVPLAAAATVLALAGAAGIAHTARITQERNRAELEARKAGEVRDFLVGLFNSNLPNQSLGDTLAVRDLLERGVARADSLRDQPELRALLLVTLGDVYRVLGRYDLAGPLLTEAAAVYDSLPSPAPLDRAGALVSLANLAYDLGNNADAVAPTREALEIQRAELGDDHADVLQSLGNLATLTGNTGDVDGAIALHTELLERRRRLLGETHPSVAITLGNLGTLYYRQERYDDAERVLREALALNRRNHPPTHPDVLLSMSNLASVLRERGELEEAETLMREALDLRREVYGDVHPRVAVSHYNLGRLLHARGDFTGAETHLRAALDIDREVYGPDHPEVGTDAFQLGSLLTEAQRCDVAIVAFEEAVRVFRANGEATRARMARARLAEGDCLRTLGREAEARRAWVEVAALPLLDADTATVVAARSRLTTPH